MQRRTPRQSNRLTFVPHCPAARRQIHKELGHRVAPDLLLNDGLAKLIDSVRLKDIFSQIEPSSLVFISDVSVC